MYLLIGIEVRISCSVMVYFFTFFFNFDELITHLYAIAHIVEHPKII